MEIIFEAITLQTLKCFKITRVEERQYDAWFDMSFRQMRQGRVRFYRVNDLFTGNWLFKVCVDKEIEKVIVRALKCPAGRRFVQLEGKSMVFKKSETQGLLYSVISLSFADEDDRIRRRIVKRKEEVPIIIRENFEITSYEEATGKKAPGKYWVALSNNLDEKAMITLFILNRAWTLSPKTYDEKMRELEKSEKLEHSNKPIEMDTGHIWVCPICTLEFHLVHIGVGHKLRHKLRKRRLVQLRM